MRADFPGGSEAAAAETTLDLTGATETNTGQKGGNTSLGTTNRIEVAAVHGRPDAGNDAYCATVQLTVPSGVTGIIARMVCSTPDATASILSGAGLYLYVGTTAAPTSAQAYICGWEWQATGTRYRAKDGVQRIGTVPAGTTIIDEQSAAGVLHALMYVPFDETGKPTKAMARVWGSGGSTNGLSTGNNTAALSTGAEVHMGFCCDQQNASPGDVLDMQVVVFTYEWTY
jgi:hypothetical protein